MMRSSHLRTAADMAMDRPSTGAGLGPAQYGSPPIPDEIPPVLHTSTVIRSRAPVDQGMTAPQDNLRVLRRSIEQLDGEIAQRIGRRLELARRLARTKSRTDRALRDYGVEGRVVRRWVRTLRSAGVEPARSEALARWLIEEAVRVQEPIVHHPGRRTVAGALDIAIVGGAGAMGRWLGEFFDSSGHRVSIVDPEAGLEDRPRYASVEAAAAVADAVVFATPMRATAPLLKEALAGRRDLLVFDILSVKAPIARLLLQGVRDGRQVTSVHPMFGPSARTLSGRNLLIVSCGNPRADAAARALFASSALTISEVSLREHDRLMAESLGLSHAVNLLFLGVLSTSDVSEKEFAHVASTTFHRQSALALSVAREGVELYLDIQASNPHSRHVYRTLRSRLAALEQIVGRRDLESFRRWLADGRSMLEAGPSPMRN
jgi:chorismate mutase / prephenate dehydrogenase